MQLAPTKSAYLAQLRWGRLYSVSVPVFTAEAMIWKCSHQVRGISVTPVRVYGSLSILSHRIKLMPQTGDRGSQTFPGHSCMTCVLPGCMDIIIPGTRRITMSTNTTDFHSQYPVVNAWNFTSVHTLMTLPNST